MDKQALQRAHRIGQMNHVMSINLVTECTVEEVIMRRAERKLQLSHNVIGEDVTNGEGKDMPGIETGDLRSVIFGLHMFDPTDISSEISDELNMSELNAMVEKVIALRDGKQSDKDERKVGINSTNVLTTHDLNEGGGLSSVTFDPGLDEAAYLSWVEKFKETSKSNDNAVLDLGNRRGLPEEKYLKAESARKKAEEKMLAKWDALGYQSLSVKDPVCSVERDSDSGSVTFVYGDCTQPSKVCPSEPTIIFSCVDDSGSWGHGGMFDAMAKLSARIPSAYERASEVGDLHLGDLHIIEVTEDPVDTPQWVALAVVQSYNSRRKVPRSSISIPDLERCLSKASFSAAQNSASIHMPRVGYQEGSDRSEWYTVERLLRKYSAIHGINIFVYYYRRSAQA